MLCGGWADYAGEFGGWMDFRSVRFWGSIRL